jgi:lipoic acid synthetase
VKRGTPGPPDLLEPEKVAEAAADMGLRHVVITSVTRDDLPDGGASLFAETLRQVRDRVPGATVEVLIPDFRGSEPALTTVMRERPEILNHNVETVPRLYPEVRPQARYDRSLELLRRAREQDPSTRTKSGFMLGLGERSDEITSLMADLRRVGCDILTIGQYLQPTRDRLPVFRYCPPEEFLLWKREALAAGFSWVESGPQVRSSYNAEAQAMALLGVRGTGPSGPRGF